MPAPLLIVTGGSLFVYPPTGVGTTLMLETSRFVLHSAMGDDLNWEMSERAVGDVINASGSLPGGFTLNHGPVDFDGHFYARLWFAGALTFQVAPFSLPVGDPVKPFVKKLPFTLTGNLTAYASDPSGTDSPPVFEFRLKGAGRVRVSMSAPADGLRSFASHFFNF